MTLTRSTRVALLALVLASPAQAWQALDVPPAPPAPPAPEAPFAPLAPPALPAPLALPAPPAVMAWAELQNPPRPPQPPRSRNDQERLYDRGQRALDDGRWDEAAMSFSRLAETGGPRTDAALYWTAYAQNRLGQRTEALQTIAALLKSHANSRYTAQARALEVEVRRDAGQPVRPEAQNDEELKLFALQALQRIDPERAFPMLETILRGTATPRLKTRALFVLAQSNTPKARQVVTEIARGNLSPELQERAIDYLGGQRDAEHRALFSEIYAGGDVDVKRRVLRAFAASGDKDRILAAATSEAAPELRGEAVRLLGALRASAEVAALYQKESDVGVKRQMLQAMVAGGDTPYLIELARTEPNPELRRQAVRNLGVLGAQRTGSVLVAIFSSDASPEIRRAATEGLFIQRNSEALVGLARKESDPRMKRDLVEKLAQMRDDKVALDYLLELLK